MKRFFFFAFLFLVVAASAQTVNGKIKSTGDADLHVIRLFADSFPQVSLTFQAQAPSGDPVWNLQQSDVRVQENDRPGKITSFKLLSADQHLQTMLVIDHSGSMNFDARYWDWYRSLNMDSLPNDTITSYYTGQHCVMINAETSSCTGTLVRRDTFYIAKRLPNTYKTPLWYAQQGAKVFLRSLSAKDSAGVIGFSDSPDVYVASARGDERSNYQIDGMRANGSTAFYDAVDRSLNHLVYHRGLRAIVALTDGKDNASRLSLQNVIDKAKKMRCPVYVIGLGDVDAIALQKLAAETGGELYLTNDATQLEKVYLTISRKLQSVYEVVYESPFLKSTEPTHELQLRFDVDSMFLKSQLIELPLPESVITHLQARAVQQDAFQQQYPLVEETPQEKTEETTATVEPASTTDPALPENEFPYATLGVTFLAAGAGVLIYRKKQRQQKQPALTIVGVFPNPSTGPVTIQYAADAGTSGLRLVVLNASGTEVFSQALSAEMQSTSIDLGGETNGMYLVRIESANGVSQTERVILQR